MQINFDQTIVDFERTVIYMSSNSPLFYSISLMYSLLTLGVW